MPSETLPDVYRMKRRVWLCEAGAQLWITETDLPLALRSVEIRTLTALRLRPS